MVITLSVNRRNMAAAYRLQHPYLYILYLSTSEHLKTCDKEIFGITDRDRNDPTRFKWGYFYQELEYVVLKFLFKAAVHIINARDTANVPSEYNNMISYYPLTTKPSMDSHCDDLRSCNSGSGLGCEMC